MLDTFEVYNDKAAFQLFSFLLTNMASIPVILTSLGYSISTSIFFSTVYQTLTPQSTLVQFPTTAPSTATFSTLIMYPFTITATSYPSTIQIPTSTITETFKTTITQPGHSITYYPPQTTTTIQVTAQIMPTNSTFTISPTTTITELIYYLESNDHIYSIITATLPTQTQDYPFIVVPGALSSDSEDNGWNSWSDAQKGGLIAGVVIASLLLLGIAVLLLWCLRRRRKIWVASEWETNPSMAGQQYNGNELVIPWAYWGPRYR